MREINSPGASRPSARMPANASWLGAPWNASVGAKMRSFRSVTAIPCGGSPSLHAPSATAASSASTASSPSALSDPSCSPIFSRLRSPSTVVPRAPSSASSSSPPRAASSARWKRSNSLAETTGSTLSTATSLGSRRDASCTMATRLISEGSNARKGRWRLTCRSSAHSSSSRNISLGRQGGRQGAR